LEFQYALLMFFSGVLAHALAIRIFGTWNKGLLYKLTFINCLVILRYCEKTSKEMLYAATGEDPESKRSLEIIFRHWQQLALYSMKNIIPDVVWQQISVNDWDQAMKILKKIEKGVENEAK